MSDWASVIAEYPWRELDYGVLTSQQHQRERAAKDVAESLLVLLETTSEDEAHRAYDRGLENTVFLSGMVFGSAFPVTDCILRVWPGFVGPGRGWALCALEQIVNGADAGTYSTTPGARTVEACQTRLRQEDHILYEALFSAVPGDRWSAVAALRAIEQDHEKLRTALLEVRGSANTALGLRQIDDVLARIEALE